MTLAAVNPTVTNILEFHSLGPINGKRVHQRVLNLLMHLLFSKVSVCGSY